MHGGLQRELTGLSSVHRQDTVAAPSCFPRRAGGAAESGGTVTRDLADLTTVDAGGGFDVVTVTNQRHPGHADRPGKRRAALTRAPAHLCEKGHLLVEVCEASFQRQLSRPCTRSGVPGRRRLVVESISGDPVGQGVVLLRGFVVRGVTETFPVVSRCAWRGEVDLMVEPAGLRLGEGWREWSGVPFGRSAVRHVSR